MLDFLINNAHYIVGGIGLAYLFFAIYTFITKGGNSK